MPRSQSAVEFVTTYAFVILIITIVISIVITIAYVPKSSIPQSCDIYGGFTCTDVGYYNLSGNIGSSLIVSAVDAEPGIINISSFNAVVNYKSSTKGACYPNPVSQGDIVYCIANFSVSARGGAAYSGTLNMSAEYCTPGAGSIANSNCSAAEASSVFAGSFVVSGSPGGVPHFIIPLAYAPITITNAQGIAAQGPFQQYLVVDSQAYGQYINSQWSNVEFTEYKPEINGGLPLDAWVEYGASNSVSSTGVWVKLPGGLPADGNTVIYMNFVSKNVISPSGPTGEAPQLSATYGQYDDIAAVMNKGLLYQFYDDNGNAGSGCSSQNGVSNIIAAGMAEGSQISIAGCSAFTAASGPSTTPFTGSTGHSCIDTGGTIYSKSGNYMVLNYWNTVPDSSSSCYTSAGGPEAVPSRYLSSQTADPYIVKVIGWAEVNPTSTVFSGVFNDGGLFYFVSGSGVGGGSGSNWLGSSYPTGTGSFLEGQPATIYQGQVPSSSGAYRMELDYYQDSGAAYLSFNASNTVDYYSATPPPGSVAPTYTFGSVVVT